MSASTDLAENLQVIKVEPTTPEKANIKERLNLHVKRRLQQDLPSGSSETITDAGDGSKRTKLSQSQAKEPSKPRKLNQKRLEKPKLETSKGKKASVQLTNSVAEMEPLDDGQDMDGNAEIQLSDPKNSNQRDRYKNADILNMVLSAKKRALLQHPEVQAFWSEIMAAIKS